MNTSTPPDLNDLAAEIHVWAHSKGFWQHAYLDYAPPESLRGIPNPSIVPEKLMLIVTEVAEAMEGWRDDDDENVAEELADIVIRVLDLSAYLGVDLQSEIEAKVETNRKRPQMHGRVR